jgi:two-component system phosphate regulon response regulator PhoB
MQKYIQVVEDDEDIRFCVQYVLEDADFYVETFEDAASFNNRLRRDNVDLIILDVMLPDGNGIDICKNIKADFHTNDIPVVIMSAHANPNVILQNACANDFICKPFDIDYFLERVKSNLHLTDKNLQSNS